MIRISKWVYVVAAVVVALLSFVVYVAYNLCFNFHC